MTCDECRDLLQERVDNELPPSERAAMDSHIEGCDECRQLERQLAKFTTTMVKTVQPIRPE